MGTLSGHNIPFKSATKQSKVQMDHDLDELMMSEFRRREGVTWNSDFLFKGSGGEGRKITQK